KMKMEEEFADLKEKIVYLYPRNYGKKVNQMYITYKHNKDKKVSVILHEIGKDKNGYCDKAIRAGMAKKENGQWNYNFYLKQQEININNLYYLFIEEKE
ncbi:MAG: hypothetical protein IJ335_05155, partial [Lachnospiraceae bacterium]|nr:hypothetical protein [Lachnospiraceae bacterium]